MNKVYNYTKIIVSIVIFFVLLFLILFNIITNDYIGFFFIASCVFIIFTTMYTVSLKNGKLILENFFITESLALKEVVISNVHTFKRGIFCVVINNKTYYVKANKNNYDIIHSLLKTNIELQKKMEKLKRDSWFSF